MKDARWPMSPEERAALEQVTDEEVLAELPGIFARVLAQPDPWRCGWCLGTKHACELSGVVMSEDSAVYPEHCPGYELCRGAERRERPSAPPDPWRCAHHFPENSSRSRCGRCRRHRCDVEACALCPGWDHCPRQGRREEKGATK